jgi:hypothetical protein
MTRYNNDIYHAAFMIESNVRRLSSLTYTGLT